MKHQAIKVSVQSRLGFPEEEQRFDWLPMLLDAYAIVDQGVAEAIGREVKQGRTLACAKGCSECCKTHKDIPVYPLELVGMTWYATEKMQTPMREKCATQLQNYREGAACPFLVDDACSIHSMRPMACRQFNVFDRVCAPGEDAYHTRRADVLTPIKKYASEAFFIMLPFYGVKDKVQRREMIKTGQHQRLVKVLQQCNWNSLAEKMRAWDAK